MKHRSAAERSWVAHIGLLALVIMAFAPLVLPSWNVEAPALFGQTPAIASRAAATAPAPSRSCPGHARQFAAGSAPPRRPTRRTSISAAAAASAIYAVPAAILLFITLLALARLVALRARAEVLVDGHWLSALARAQRRMGFKHGTALLTSNELASPISWGLMRPVILLNTRAVEASGEAEAIIAHELAHVARMDWVKLLLARIATALFWFNPLVWMLAREAHQLREEAADDAVLAPTSPTPIMPSCWSALPGTNARACCSARTASRRRRARLPAASLASSTASRCAGRSRAASRSACSSARSSSPPRSRR